MGPPAEIVDVVAAAPRDRAARAVLADWLQQHGDPRGELVALQLHADRTPEIEQRIRELTRTLDPSPSLRWVTWADGFARSIVVDEQSLAQLPPLLRGSASWGITELIAVEAPLDRLVGMLAEYAGALPALTSLQLRTGTGAERIDIEPLVIRLPRLARLRVDVPHAPFWLASDLAELSVTIDGEQRPTWAERPQPALESLWLRSWAPLQSARWLAPDRLPGLQRLGLVARGPSTVPDGFALARCETVVCDARGYATAWQIDDPAAEAAREHDAALIALGGDGVTPGTVIPVRGEQFWIGRTHGGVPDLHISSTWISRRHTRLLHHGGWSVHDGSTANGTWLDNVPLDEHRVPLRDGAELQCGRTFLRFVQR